jgi:hypothetical protein
MIAYVAATNNSGAKTVRPSDDDLHRAACKAIHGGEQAIFGMLPSVLAQIIKHKVWKTRQKPFKDFGEYALDQTSDGLGISNNQRLWMLRCALDVHGDHVGEWAATIQRVEKMVHVQIKAEGGKIRSVNGNSLEALAKTCCHGNTDTKITYLPSRAQRSDDGHLIRLQRIDAALYKRVVAGKVLLREAVKTAGLRRADSDANRDPVERASMYIRRMQKADVKRLVEWMRSEGYL